MIRLEKVSKHFTTPGSAPHVALDSLSLLVESGETLCLIGGSGSGKTTTLRLINRLEEPTNGRVTVDGRDVREHDPIELRRRMGYVVQRGALFPHLTVRENVGLLCRLESWDRKRERERVEELMDLVRLSAKLGERYPIELSGGQRQRVGVARALALDPPIVLFDEPFGALDPITRRELQLEFEELRRTQERTMVFVTHDLREAFRLGDRIALLHDGRLAQVGSPSEFRTRPADDYVASFVSHHSGLGEDS